MTVPQFPGTVPCLGDQWCVGSYLSAPTKLDVNRPMDKESNVGRKNNLR